MANEKIRCTVPGCKKELPSEAMWLPEWKALLAANNGRPVAIADFPKFALCGYHGHLLRQEGVRVYRYADSVAREKRIDERREAERMSWRPFADRFLADKAKKPPERKGDGRRRGTGDGRNVGQGLSRCAKMDADKRPSAQPAESPTDGSADPAPKP